MPTTDLQQRIVALDQGSVNRDERGTVTSPEPQMIYFDVQVLEPRHIAASPEHDHSGEQKSALMLSPNGTYLLVISPRNAPTFGQYSLQNGLPSGTDLKLRMLCSTIHLDHSFIVEKALPSSPHKEIEFTLPEEMPTCDEAFTLECEGVTEEGTKIITILNMKVQGNRNRDDPKLINDVLIDTSLAQKTAILHIKADAKKLQMTGWSRRGTPFQTDPMDWGPSIKLTEFLEKNQNPKLVIGTVRGISRTQGEPLRDWLKPLLKLYGEQFCLIIVDHTDFEIPWEMIELDRYKYLGVQTTTVRWLKVSTFSGPRKLTPMDAQEQEKVEQGTIVAYIDQRRLREQQISLEREALMGLKIKKDCQDWREVKQQLELHQTSHDVGLIYFGCHGVDEGLALGSTDPIADGLTYQDLELIDEYTDPRPLVFANACGSARTKPVGDYWRGLPEAFLANIASGYIGTLGQVNSTYASAVAKRILQAACRYPKGIRVAEMLRALREEAAREWEQCHHEEVDEEERLRIMKQLLYAFMYVYYGDTNLRLQLTSAEDSETTA